MIKGIYSSGAGLAPRTSRLEVLANNIANVNTTGFKKDSLFIEAMKDAALAQSQEQGELKGLQSRQFVDFSEGSFMETKNPLDFAIQGRGFFVVETPQGIRYTRNGNFSLAVDGTVVNGQGFPVMGSSGKIVIPDTQKLADTSISVNQHGDIALGSTQLGKIRIADFENLNLLKKDGSSLFSTEAEEKPVSLDSTNTVVRQGYLEESNVEGIHEMIELVELTRSFETDQRTIQAQDSTLERAMEIGRV
jgi:flagellar basal-body rod protein FlgF